MFMPQKSPVVALLRPPVLFWVGLCMAVNGGRLWAQQDAADNSAGSAPITDQQLEFFENQVRPLLVKRCYECHGPDADPVEGGLGLVSREALLTGGDSGPAIDPGSPAESHLLSAIEYGDLFQMPPDSRLPDAEIDILRRWVLDGAPWPAGESAAVNRDEDFDLLARRTAHWCWQPIHRPALPQPDSDWALDPLDRFVLEKLQQHGLVPAAPADRGTWLRRVTFDLTGLPPTAAEIQQFLNDSSPNSFETVVDRLLDSPRFGERWARHWMDLVRYAETCGHEFDYPIPNAWQYRDYLIRAFNADVPYDDFVVEHIAGDMHPYPRLNPDNQIDESTLGTGFWFLGEATHGPVDVKGDEAGRIDNQIDVMSKTFLGLTVACARCHDHKFDAISTADYYGISGFLQSSRRQDVMLDPDRRILDSFKEAARASREASQVITDFLTDVSDWPGSPEISKYMQAAVLYLQQDGHWRIPKRRIIEGESLKALDKSAGKARRQEISGWSGGGQIWWTGARPGDELVLEFTTPEAGTYELSVVFTRAPDYGIVDVLINGLAAASGLDLFAGQVERTDELALGAFDLDAGAQRLTLRIRGKNEAAVDGYMVGIDRLIVAHKTDDGIGIHSKKALEALCDRFQVESDQLTRWIDAIRDPAASEIDHPLNLLRRAAESGVDFDSGESARFFTQWLDETEDQQQQWQRWLDATELFADDFTQWSKNGFAFYTDLINDEATWLKSEGQLNVSGQNPLWNWRTSPVHSGILGGRFQGVLRSPTFEITHPEIHYRVSGQNGKIRLIIDGFRLDVYNPLLFGGMQMEINTDGRRKWVTQAGDLKNYLGHRAFIEVIDDGDGFVSIEEVRFGDGARPVPEPSRQAGQAGAIQRLAASAAGRDPQQWSLKVAADALAMATAKPSWVPQEELSLPDPSLLNVLVRHRLIPELDYETLEQAISTARQRIAEINAHTPAPLLAVGMVDGSPENEYVFVRGNHKNPGPEVPRGPITALRDPQRWNISPGTSGRWDLAQNMIAPENPLTRRVIVNRIWHHLTGRGIVASVDNFGVLGTPPSHPELLDYLACEFDDSGWSIKSLIRRIVLSQTYRMSSTAGAAASERDPDNQLLQHFRVRRLQAEAIRDGMLAVSGELNETMFGPPVPIHLTPFMQGRGRPGQSGPLDGNGRRSVYIEVRRNFLAPMMLAFDTPIPFNTMGRRNRSNVPAQALILLNDPFVMDQARKWAARLVVQHSEFGQRVTAIYVSALGRPPTESELDKCPRFY